MVHDQLLQFEQDASGKFIYTPQPDEQEFMDALHFNTSYELALRLRESEPNWVQSQWISEETIIKILPDWLKNVIIAIGILGELLINRFMEDGKWVKLSKWKVGWNIKSLIMLYLAAKDVVKAFKKTPNGES